MNDFKQKLTNIPIPVGAEILESYFKENELEIDKRNGFFGRIVFSLYLGSSHLVISNKGIVGIEGIFFHQAGSKSPPNANHHITSLSS